MFSVSQSVDATIFLPSGYPYAPYQSRLLNFGVENNTGSSFSSFLVYALALFSQQREKGNERKYSWLPDNKSLLT